ncbi:DUF3301 domain-containing protein [Paraglaciecola sp.]|uniref:DUF3301 domain-containing protein n=1 Tax=Paraglaciecola sp. TaxID=1920173 RepID=UPI003EF9843B
MLCLGIFWRFRAASEAVKTYLDSYCEQRNLQLISVARHNTKISSYRGKLDFTSEFTFEFSGNGEDSYQGQIIMIGLHVLNVELPAYRVE